MPLNELMPLPAAGFTQLAAHESPAEVNLPDATLLRPLKVAQMLRNLQADAIVHEGISIILEVDESLHIVADELLLTGAIGTLVHHAIKMSRTPSRLTLRARAENDGAVVELENDCASQPPDLWEPLLESTNENNRAPGLAVSKRIIEHMQGSIRTSSEPGGSCAVLLMFPLVQHRSSAPDGLASRRTTA